MRPTHSALAESAIRHLFGTMFARFGGVGDPTGLLHREADELHLCAVKRVLHDDEGRGEATVAPLAIERRAGCMVLPRPHIGDVVRSAASLARAQRRRAAIDAVTDERDPAWSMSAHPLVRAGMLHFGIDPVPVRIDHEEEPGVRKTSTIDQIMTDRRAMLKVTAGQIWSFYLRDDPVTLDIGGLRSRTCVNLYLPGVLLPETMLSVIPGMRLSQLVDHPIVDLVPDLLVTWAGPRITKDKNGNIVHKGHTFVVAGRPVAFASPPPGADVSWMRLPALHRNDIEV